MNSEHDDFSLMHAEVHGVRKAVQHSAPDIAANATKLLGILCDATDDACEFSGESFPESGLALLIPDARLRRLGLRLRSETHRAGHRSAPQLT